MPRQTDSENSGWVGFVILLTGFVLAVLMLCAMFSTRSQSYPKRNQDETYGPGEQIERFQGNVGKSFRRTFGDIL